MRKRVRVLLRTTMAGAALLFTSGVGHAQFLFTNDTNTPDRVVGFGFLDGAPPSLSSIPAFVFGGGSTQMRWAIGDLDRDDKPELVITFPILANQGRLLVFTFDPQNQTYLDRGSINFIAPTDGRVFTGDVDGDGGDEVVFVPFGTATPAPRPAGGGTQSIHVFKVFDVDPLLYTTHALTQQFITRHMPVTVRDFDGDGRAEILMLSQETDAASPFNEPLGAASFFGCRPVLTNPAACNGFGSGSVPPNPEGRFPTSVDAADVDADGKIELVVGWGTACQPNDSATVALFETSGGAQVLQLPAPFQKLAAADIDGDGKVELAVSGRNGSAGSLQVYRHESGNFQLKTQTPVSFPTHSCTPPTSQTGFPLTAELPAAVGIARHVDFTDPCDGVDNDNDGLIDEDFGGCVERHLFVPVCWASGDAAEFQTAVDRWKNFFLDKSLLSSCGPGAAAGQQKIWIESAPLGTVACPSSVTQFNDLNASALLTELKTKYDLRNFDVVAFASTLPDEPCGAGFAPGGGLITLKSEGFTPFPGEYVTYAHEVGHVIGLGEEYRVDAGEPNEVSGAFGCDPTTCCNNPHDCASINGQLCLGNLALNASSWSYGQTFPAPFGDGSRCIMTNASGPGWDTGEPGTGVGSHRAWCGRCLQHWTTFGPKCSQTYVGVKRRLQLAGLVDNTGHVFLELADLDIGRLGHAPAQSGSVRIEVRDPGGVLIGSFAPKATSLEPGIEPDGVSFWERLPVTDTAALPLVVKSLKAGVVVSQTTLGGSPPTANAGSDQTVECSQHGGGAFSLDGRGSSDADGDTLSYSWSGPAVSFDDATSPTPIAIAPVGTRSVNLVVHDGFLDSAPDTMTITVQDTVAPQLSGPNEITVVACQAGLTQVTLPLPSAVEVCSPDQLTFTGTIVESNGAIVSPPVVFNNGSAPASALTAGVHTVQWRVTDAAGRFAEFVQQVRVESCWPMFRRTAEHRGSSPFVGPATDNLLWRFVEAHGDLTSSPAVGADGTIYFGSWDRNVYAVNPNGTLKWKRATGGLVRSSPAVGFGGTVFVGSDDDKLYALNPQNGNVICSRRLGDRDVESSPAIGRDGTVYVGSEDRRLYALNGTNCSLRWTFSTGGEIKSSPAVGPDGVIYVGSEDNRLYAVNPNGTAKWSVNTGGDVSSSPALSPDGHAVYVGSDDDRLYARETATGNALWAADLDLDVKASPAVGADGTIYVGSEDGNMYALDPADGSVLWSQDVGPDVFSSAAIGADGTVYVGSDDERIYALDGQTGLVRWSYKTSGNIKSSPAIGAGGVLYVTSNDDKLYAFGVPQALTLSLNLASETPASGASGTEHGCSVGSGRGGTGAPRSEWLFALFTLLALSRRRHPGPSDRKQ